MTSYRLQESCMTPGPQACNKPNNNYFRILLWTNLVPRAVYQQPGCRGRICFILLVEQNDKSKIFESSEIIIGKTTFRAFRHCFAKQQKSHYDSSLKGKYPGTKWQKKNQNRRNKSYNMTLKLCEPKNMLEFKPITAKHIKCLLVSE